MKRVLFPAIALSLLGIASPALAKGDWLDFGYYVQPGEAVVGEDSVIVRSKEGARRTIGYPRAARARAHIENEGPFFGYLVSHRYGATKRVRDGDALKLAEVEFSEGSVKPWWRYVGVRLAFTVPDVAPGTYEVHLCNSPCTTNLKYMSGSLIQVVANGLEERIYRRMDEADAQLDRVAFRLRRTNTVRLRELKKDLTSHLKYLSSHVTRIEHLERRLARQSHIGGNNMGWAGVAAITAILTLATRSFAMRRRKTGV